MIGTSGHQQPEMHLLRRHQTAPAHHGRNGSDNDSDEEEEVPQVPQQVHWGPATWGRARLVVVNDGGYGQRLVASQWFGDPKKWLVY